jgi:phage shock protein A
LDATRLTESIHNNEALCAKLESKVTSLKEQILTWENELTTMKARYKVASSTKKINKQLVSMSDGSTAKMLADAKTKIQEEEALAMAYDEMLAIEGSIDDEINKAIGTSYSSDVQASLAELKMKIDGPPKALEDKQRGN